MNILHNTVDFFQKNYLNEITEQVKQSGTSIQSQRPWNCPQIFPNHPSQEIQASLSLRPTPRSLPSNIQRYGVMFLSSLYNRNLSIVVEMENNIFGSKYVFDFHGYFYQLYIAIRCGLTWKDLQSYNTSIKEVLSADEYNDFESFLKLFVSYRILFEHFHSLQNS